MPLARTGPKSVTASGCACTLGAAAAKNKVKTAVIREKLYFIITLHNDTVFRTFVRLPQ